MNRRLSHLAVALAAVLMMAACAGSESPTAPQMLFDDQSLSGEAMLPMIDICHITDDGSFHIINISQNAQPGHLGHGDIFPIVLPNGSLACELPTGCDVTFDAASATATFSPFPFPGGYDVMVDWTTSGSEADGSVTYAVEAVFYNSSGDANSGINESQTVTVDTQTNQDGSGSFSSSFFVSIFDAPDAYRIRAICGSGEETSVVVEWVLN